jgi:hypothetical protein
VTSLLACKHGAKPKTSPTPAPFTTPSATPTAGVSAVPLGPLDADRTTPQSFAYYESWFEGGPEWGHWRWTGHDPSVVNDAGLPNVAAARHPELGAYDSRDDALLGAHLLMLKGAGFDGVIVGWHGERTPTEDAALALLAKARAWDIKYGFRFSFMLRIDSAVYTVLPPVARPDAVREDLDRLLGAFGESPIYQRFEAQPVLFFLPRPDPGRPNQPVLTRAEWARIRAGTRRPFRLAYQDAGPAWRGVVDLPFAWLDAARDAQDDGGKYLDWFYASFVAMRARGWDLPTVVGAAYPGFDDSGVYGWTHNPGQHRVVDRTIDGQSTLARTWSHVFDHNAAQPDNHVVWMQTASWNDWNTGTEIEPSVERGSADYEMAAAQNQRFRGIHSAPTEALMLARAYYAGRHSGLAETDFADAIERFAAGDPQAAVRLLPKRVGHPAADPASAQPF